MAPWYFCDTSSWHPNSKISEMVKRGNGVIGLRVGYGSKEDTKWKAWRDQARGADVVLLYHFAVKSGRNYGLTVQGCAEWFVQTVGRLRKNEVPVLDVEAASGKWSKADCEKWMKYVHLKLGGPKPMIYANQSYVHENGLASLFTTSKGWVAKYGSPGKGTVAPTVKWVAWQLSDGNYGDPRPDWPGAGRTDTNRVDVSKAEFVRRVKSGVATVPPTMPKYTRVLEWNPATMANQMTGPDVTAVQKRLIAKGHPLPRYGADGEYGPETVRAVKAFQSTAGGLTSTGKVGPRTWAKLFGG